MNDFIQRHKSYLIRCIKGFDSSLKAKKFSLYSIMQDIDADSSLTDEDIHHKFNVFYNKTILVLRRTGQTAKINWLDSNSSIILKYLYLYAGLCKSVYRTDTSLIDWYRSTHNEDGTDLVLLHNNDLGSILFENNGVLYSVDVFEGGDSFKERHIEIGNMLIPEEQNESTKFVTYSLNYETTPNKGDSLHTSIKAICNNADCPRWKQSLSKPYNDNSKDVSCSLKDCQGCSVFEECKVLRPLDAVTIVKSIYECMLTREYKKSDSSDKKDYEHIPLPQREDDVVIYFGTPKPKKTLADIGIMSVDEVKKSSIVSSHASPREHHRRGGDRREFTRVVNGKVQNVRATTFRETVVNQGNTKTNYTLKQRKK